MDYIVARPLTVEQIMAHDGKIPGSVPSCDFCYAPLPVGEQDLCDSCVAAALKHFLGFHEFEWTAIWSDGSESVSCRGQEPLVAQHILVKALTDWIDNVAPYLEACWKLDFMARETKGLQIR